MAVLEDKALDLGARQKRAAPLVAYLLGVRPCPGPDGTTVFYCRPDAGVPVYIQKSHAEVHCAAEQALRFFVGGGVARPSMQHFSKCHFPLLLTSCGIEAECGEAFLASLDPAGVVPLADACVVVDLSPIAKWNFVVHKYDAEPTFRFTKTLPVKWTKPYQKLRRAPGELERGMETDTGEFVPLWPTLESSALYTGYLKHVRTDVGWSDGARDPLHLAMNLVRMGSLVTFEIVPQQKAIFTFAGPVNSGKSTLIRTLMGPLVLGDFCSGAGLRGTDKAQSSVNWKVRHDMTTSKAVIFGEQESFDVRVLRDA